MKCDHQFANPIPSTLFHLKMFHTKCTYAMENRVIHEHWYLWDCDYDTSSIIYYGSATVYKTLCMQEIYIILVLIAQAYRPRI